VIGEVAVGHRLRLRMEEPAVVRARHQQTIVRDLEVVRIRGPRVVRDPVRQLNDAAFRVRHDAVTTDRHDRVHHAIAVVLHAGIAIQDVGRRQNTEAAAGAAAIEVVAAAVAAVGAVGGAQVIRKIRNRPDALEFLGSAFTRANAIYAIISENLDQSKTSNWFTIILRGGREALGSFITNELKTRLRRENGLRASIWMGIGFGSISR